MDILLLGCFAGVIKCVFILCCFLSYSFHFIYSLYLVLFIISHFLIIFRVVQGFDVLKQYIEYVSYDETCRQAATQLGIAEEPFAACI